MAPRANWKGYLRLSLVSCPIALYPASSLSEKVSFNRQPIEAAERGFRNGRGGAQGGHRAGV
jgi:non-homologous end joining protein Ku